MFSRLFAWPTALLKIPHTWVSRSATGVIGVPGNRQRTTLYNMAQNQTWASGYTDVTSVVLQYFNAML